MTRPKRDRVLWISNLALVLLTSAFLWAAFSHYQDRMTAISLAESSFLTTEWRLLTELKAQTDQQLFQKDQEIADLNRLYLELIKNNTSPSQLLQVRSQLEQAEAERAAIMSRSISATAGADSALSASVNERLSSGNELALTGLLQEQIAGLQTQLDRRRALIDALDKERMILISTHQQVEQRYDDTLKDDVARISELSAELSRVGDEVRAAAAEMNRKVQESGPALPIGIDVLKTQALVRALVGSPEIRATYPDLLSSFDRLFDEYGRQERLKGEKEAFASAESVLESLAGKVGAR